MLDLWPSVFAHCLISSCLLLCQAELQRSCSQHGMNRGAELLCPCSTYPPVPPPPPPPPPPRGLTAAAPEASAPLPRPWWMEIIVLGMIGSALAVFILLTVIIWYKAIKRKPKKMEMNGTNCGEDAMSSFKKTNTAAVGTPNPKEIFPANHKVNEVGIMQSDPEPLRMQLEGTGLLC